MTRRKNLEKKIDKCENINTIVNMKTSNEPLLSLKQTFGFQTFRPGQEEIVKHILAGRSALAVFPTGGGKSLCYQLPALLLEGLTLVISPLIALMKDQIDFLQGKGIAAERLDSSQSDEESHKVWDSLRQGKLKLLYIAPERLANERFRQQLGNLRISLMVIDEAHCISEWGHNFRPDYMKLAGLARSLQAGRVLALTATATPAVAEDIRNAFEILPEAYVNTGFHRPNLTLRVLPTNPQARDALLLQNLRQRPKGATIIYVTLQKTAENVADFLSRNGMAARAYHAGLPPEQRNEVQDFFMSSPHGIVVATIAFGMGIDKANIRYVDHYNPPKSLENFMQETGRAGRDGKKAVCTLLYCAEDLAVLENFAYGNTPSRSAIEQILAEIMRCTGDIFDCSHYALSQELDTRPLVLSTLLTYLEIEGLLQAAGTYYNNYKIQFIRPPDSILAGFDQSRQQFLQTLFAQARQARTWCQMDIDQAAQACKCERSRILKALHYLEEKQALRVQALGLMHRYRILRKPAQPARLASRLWDNFRRAERRDLERIRSVAELAEGHRCLVQCLLAHFGETLAKPCGHCSHCLGEQLAPGQSQTFDQAPNLIQDPDNLALIRQTIKENNPALKTPRQLARFLCGINSPAATRAKLHRDKRFGTLAHHRFADVTHTAKTLTLQKS